MTLEAPGSSPAPAAEARPWRVLIADDDPMARGFMATILGSQADLEVVAEASDGAEAIEAARRHRPDVILMDVNMPNVAGAEATEAVLAQLSTAIIAITSWATRDVVDRMLIAGALGFLHKDVSPQALIDGVRTVARGEGFVSGAEMSALIRRYVEQTGDPARIEAVRLFATLSERERTVARLVAEGATNPEIAARTYVSPATVKTQLEQVFIKLGQRDRVGVAVMVERAGFGPA